MQERDKSSVQIIVRADGVDRVQLRGRSWDDESVAQRIYQRIAPLIRQIHRCLKSSDRVGGGS